MDNFAPKWISKARAMVSEILKRINNERGEVVIPFIESVAEEQRPSVSAFINNSGVTSEDIAGFKSFDEFLSGYKPKSQSIDWTSALTEEQQAIVKLKGWRTPGDSIKSYGDLEKMVGGEKIPLPKKDKSGNYEKGELERYLSAIGLPKDSKEYKLPEGMKLPEGVKLDETLMADFAVRAHKVGLLPHQYQFMMTELAGLLNKGDEAQKAQNEKQYNESALALRQKFGAAYDQNVKLASRVLESFSDKAKGAEIVTKYGNDPVIIELLANIGKNLSEEGLSKVGMVGSVLDPASATQMITKIRAEHSNALNDNMHPEHKYWVAKLDEMYKLAYGQA